VLGCVAAGSVEPSERLAGRNTTIASQGRVTEAEARERFASARVARLATIGVDGRPHLVPIVFALAGDTIVTAVDAKPKRTRALRRLANIDGNPHVAVLVDHYSDDWRALWWVRADGTGRVMREAGAVTAAIELLVTRYEQYREQPPTGPVVAIVVDRWSGWSAS
jgi:PPOX class probable F420-dependent enzyme